MTRVLSLTALAAAGALAFAPMAFAEDEYNVSSGLTASGKPLGMHGYDPVAHLASGSAVHGEAKHGAVYDGVQYYFSTAAAQTAVEAAPNDFLPQNGGFCTFGVAVGKKFDGDARYADVVDGKLYLFLNAEVFAAYEKDKAGVIAKADEMWPSIRSTASADL